MALDTTIVTDTTFTRALRGFAAKAGQVVVFNDPGFSGEPMRLRSDINAVRWMGGRSWRLIRSLLSISGHASE